MTQTKQKRLYEVIVGNIGNVVYTLGRVLWPNGFGLKCDQCGRLPTKKGAVDAGQPARAPQCNRGHKFYGRNGNTTGWDSDGGYALKQEWL